jgi:hypothetical protein
MSIYARPNDPISPQSWNQLFPNATVLPCQQDKGFLPLMVMFHQHASIENIESSLCTNFAKNIQSISLFNNQVTKQVLNHVFEKAAQIGSVQMENCSQLTTDEFSQLRFPNTLENISFQENLASNSLDANGLRHLLQCCPKLQRLRLGICPQLSGSTDIANMPFPQTLVVADLGSITMDVASFNNFLRKVPKLKELVLNDACRKILSPHLPEHINVQWLHQS